MEVALKGIVVHNLRIGVPKRVGISAYLDHALAIDLKLNMWISLCNVLLVNLLLTSGRQCTVA